MFNKSKTVRISITESLGKLISAYVNGMKSIPFGTNSTGKRRK